MSYLNQNTENIYFGLEKDKDKVKTTNGALFHAMDSSQDYRYNESTNEWKPQKSNRWWITEW